MLQNDKNLRLGSEKNTKKILSNETHVVGIKKVTFKLKLKLFSLWLWAGRSSLILVVSVFQTLGNSLLELGREAIVASLTSRLHVKLVELGLLI